MDVRAWVLALLLSAPAPQASPSAAPPASPSPAGPTDPALDEMISRLPTSDPAAVFGALEDFISGEDGPAEKAVPRARLVLARFAAIQAALPPPAEKHAGELAQLLFTAAKALEQGGAVKEALPVYERILAEFPKAVWEGGVSQEPIANQASERLRWHREKHPWIMPELDPLLARLRAAFTGKRADELAALIARIGFWSGPFSSEGGADDPDRVLKLFDSVWPKGGVTAAADVEPFSDRSKQVFQKVSGFTGDFADAYLIVEKVPEGWQWIGVAFAAKPGMDVSADVEPVAMPTPAASPSPAPSASPR